MADIPIERKEHRSVWPWVTGIIVLLIILWLLFGRNRGTNTATTNRPDTVMTAAPPATTAPATTAPAGTPGTATPGTAAPGAAGTTGTSGTSGSPGTPQTTTPTGTGTP